jgi:two-component system response regulator EvgA
MKNLMVHSVFLADDDLNVRQALRLLLEQAGFEIAGETVDAKGMFAQVSASPPEIILIDWELPGLKAQEGICALRTYCPGTKIIALSVRPEAQHLALAAGVDGFASKGNSSDALLSILNSVALWDRQV